MTTSVYRTYVSLVILASIGLIGTTAACHRADHAPSDGAPSTPTAQVATGKVALRAPPPEPQREQLERHEASGRVIAIGDLHGDLAAARQAFRVAGVIDEADRWIGGNSVVVQTGDVLDRGSEERPLLEWLERLAVNAQQGGGAIHRINGNHEVMNVAADLRYITEAGFLQFAEYARGPLPAARSEAPEAQRGRLVAFLPGGYWAKRLAQYPVVLQVNDTVFAHGGLVPQHLEYGLERMNADFSSWMRGVKPLPRSLAGDDSPVWDRTYGESASDSDCRKLDVVLAKLAAKRLVVGHTPQKNGITFACNNRVARIDVGLSRYYGNHSAEVLEIAADRMRVLTEKDLAERAQRTSAPAKKKAPAKAPKYDEARP